ncbi:MAG: NUDIX domain-containing protein [Candidatus Aenigmarchaeota archaeon]|nr:NUDIX domain-containing protein [Candidatus Aenigmarchaeota archaeon]
MKYNFCMKCGGRVKKSKGKFVCVECGYVMYKNPKPTTAGVIMKGNKIMLVRRNKEPYKGWWDLPGGFLDEKETPERCMIREAKEETGLVVKPVKFLGFKNDEYDDQRVLGCFFLCKILGGKEKAGDDASEIRWFHKSSLPRNVAFRGVREGLKEFAGARFAKRAVK